MKKIIVFLLLVTMGKLLPVVVQLPTADVLKERAKALIKQGDLLQELSATGIFDKLGGKTMEAYAVAVAVEGSFNAAERAIKMNIGTLFQDCEKIDKEIKVLGNNKEDDWADCLQRREKIRSVINNKKSRLDDVQWLSILWSQEVLETILKDSPVAIAELSEKGIIEDSWEKCFRRLRELKQRREVERTGNY